MEKICPNCKSNFSSSSIVKKYCSTSCRSKFYEKQKITKKYFCKKCYKKEVGVREWYCYECNKIVLREQSQKHNALARKTAKIFYQKNKNNPAYIKNRNEKYKIYHKRRRQKDPQFRISVRLRNLLYQALKRYTEKGKTFSSGKYGIDFEKIISHLKPFPKEIHKWHIDHIIPLSSFNLENPEEIKKAFAPENHQWLFASDNLKKSNKKGFLILQ